MAAKLICPICEVEWDGCPHDAIDYIPLVHEARRWALKLYREKDELRCQKYDLSRGLIGQTELVTELRRQLAIAREKLEHYAPHDNWLPPLQDIARAKMNSDYKSARGILPWKEGDEPAEDAIRRLRGGEK